MTTKITAQETVRKQTEAWNSRDAARVAAGYAAGVVVNDPAYPEPLRGPAAVAKDAGDFFTAFPNFHFSPSRVLENGDTAALEGTITGTHSGPLALPTGLVPATNRSVDLKMCALITIDDMGIITSENRYYDITAMLSQLGLMQ